MASVKEYDGVNVRSLSRSVCIRSVVVHLKRDHSVYNEDRVKNNLALREIVAHQTRRFIARKWNDCAYTYYLLIYLLRAVGLLGYSCAVQLRSNFADRQACVLELQPGYDSVNGL